MADAYVIASKMIGGVGTECIVAGQKVRITPGLGISIFPDYGRDGDTLIRHADQAKYHAKQLGCNTHVVFRQDPAA